MKQDREEIKQRFSEEFGSREVTVIPANPIYEVNLKEKPEMVGAYCRVSTTAAEQAESYEMQRQQYMKTIASHPNWTLVDIYADEGVSGTSTKGRKDFQRLIDDCRAHKITLILTKSVTRFARNVVDCVETARQLKRLDPPVGIYFETSNIYTLDERSETLLNILASLAQSESEDKSAAIKWAIRGRFASGIPRIVDLYGYLREGRRLQINPETGKHVTQMYQWSLDSYAIPEISELLSFHHIPSPSGKEKWSYSTIFYILTNERYCGDVLMQKTFVQDLFTHRSVRNSGQLPQYRLDDYCPALVSKDMWAETQLKLLRKDWPDFLSTTQTITVNGNILHSMKLR